MKRVAFWLDDETHEALRQAAAENGVSVSELVRRLAREHLDPGRPVSPANRRSIS
jgi:predicted HicB family RNase H-like nuclease